MGCLKIAHRAKNEPVLRCVWNAEKQGKSCANLYDYGARFYDPVIGRFTTQDPLASDFASWTPYHYVHNNPIMFIDPTGMAADWFENELTGDVYYNSEMTNGDEGTGAMEGEGWVHMGDNDMFSDGTPGDPNTALISQNENLASSVDISYSDGTVKAEAMFEGENAQTFMEGNEYSFEAKDVKVTSDITEVPGVPTGPKGTVSFSYGTETTKGLNGTYVKDGHVVTGSVNTQTLSYDVSQRWLTGALTTNKTYTETQVYGPKNIGTRSENTLKFLLGTYGIHDGVIRHQVNMFPKKN